MTATMTEQDVGATLKVAYGFMELLDEEMKNPRVVPKEKLDSLEVAMQCIENAFGFNLKDNIHKPKEKLTDLLKKSEMGPLGARDDVEMGGATRFPRLVDIASGHSLVSTGEVYIRPVVASESDVKLADEAKSKGNEAMKNANVAEALDHYNKAIELDGNNPTYFCNRAAVHIKLEDFEKAIRDCQIAVQLQPNYARAFGRMGVAYSSQGKHFDATLCYKKALQFDPENESYQRNLQVSQRMLLQDFPAARAQAQESPNLQALFSNPSFINTATNLLQDPAMQQTLASLLRSFQPGGGGAAGLGRMEGLVQMGMAVAQQMENENGGAPMNDLAQQITNMVNSTNYGSGVTPQPPSTSESSSHPPPVTTTITISDPSDPEVETEDNS